MEVDNSSVSASYTGLASGNNGTSNRLYAANVHSATIDVFGPGFTPATTSGHFTDPTLPAGYAPFNIQNLGNILFVTYAQQGIGRDNVATGPGQGFVDEYDFNGNLITRLISAGTLNAPWGMAIAPANFGQFSNDLLVGNFGDGHIDAFNPSNGAVLGTLTDLNNNPITISGLWGLTFGNGGSGGLTNTLYFTAGPGNESLGLFGALTTPEPASIGMLGLAGATLFLRRRRK
jgi:uncharacterized protein (TIGR03118 family)